MSKGKFSTSPYLSRSDRLSDVIAAIQAAGSYKFYKLDFAGWADRISGDPSKAAHWRLVFEEHPEFFRLDTRREKASLVLRRQQPRLYDVDTGSILSKAECDLLSDARRSRLSRSPLAPGQIEALISIAVGLHSRAAEQARDRRWWMPMFFAFLGALLGGVLPTLLKSWIGVAS
jgi:hypothetical protein